MRKHLRNLAANWISHGATLVVLFFLSPYVIHTLGKVEYGLWSLLTVITGYMGLLDLGIRASTGRFIMLYLGKDDQKAVDETIRTALGFYCGLGVVAIAAGVGLGWLFPVVFRSIPPEYHLIARLLLPLLAVNVLLSALQAVFDSVLAAHERFDLARGIDLLVLAVRTTATVTALMLGYRITALAIVSVVSHVLGVVGYYVLARRVYSELRLWPAILHRTRLRELFGYGLAAFVSTVSAKIMGQTDLLIAGAAISVSATAVYSVGAMLVFYSDTFLAHIGRTLFPALQRAVARDATIDARWLFLRANRLWLICGLLPFVGMIMFAEPFIRLWMRGPQFDHASVHQAAIVMQILAGAKLLLAFVGVSGSVLNAMGRVRLTASMVAVQAIANLGLSFLFVLAFGWGLAGIAAGTLASRLLLGTFVVPWFACGAVGVPWRRYLLDMGGVGLLVGFLFAGICLAVRLLLPGDTWLWFFCQVTVATTLYAVLAYALLVPPTDRQRIRGMFSRMAATYVG